LRSPDRSRRALAQRTFENLLPACRSASVEMLSRASVQPKSPESALDEYVFHDERHFVSWQQLGKSDIGTATNLHDRNYQIERIKEGTFHTTLKKLDSL
jgi:hypothetical protein